MIGDVAGISLTVLRFDDAEEVYSQHLFIDKLRLRIVALPLGSSADLLAVTAANEQVDLNERTEGVRVAKGGICEKVSSTLFEPPAAMWFFNP